MAKQDLKKVNDIYGEIHVDVWLTDFSLGFQQDSMNFIAAAGASLITVTKESNKYVIYPRGYFWRDEAQVRPMGGRPVQVGYKVESGQYLAEEWALEHTVDDRQRQNADNQIRIDENAVTLLTGKQMIRADRIWAERAFTAGVWTQEPSGLTDFTPFNDAASNPIAVIEEWKEYMLQSTGKEPNINHQVAVEIISIADPNAMLLAYIDPNPTIDSATAIARFSWNGLIPGMTNDMGGVIERGRDDRAHSDWFQDRQAYDIRVISQDLGVFFQNAVVPVS